MRRFLILLIAIAPLWLSSCQCSDKPEIGPVEEEAVLDHAPSPDLA